MTKYRIPPYAVGFIASVLLIVSRIISFAFPDDSVVAALNTVLIIAVICTLVHLVRSTAGMREIHVWKSANLLFLWLIPVFNLLVTALQLVIPEIKFFESGFFTAVLIVFSCPSFLCYYFLYLTTHFGNSRLIKSSAAGISVITFVYIVLRLCNMIFIPMAQSAGKTVNEALVTLAHYGANLSLIIYIAAAVSFICAGSYFRNLDKEESEDEKE